MESPLLKSQLNCTNAPSNKRAFLQLATLKKYYKGSELVKKVLLFRLFLKETLYMAIMHQIDCFRLNMKYWIFLGISPRKNICQFYRHYSAMFILTFIIFYDALGTINFYFVPRNLDLFIGEMIFYFTEISVMSKVLTFFFLRDKITKTLNALECDIFQPCTAKGFKIIDEAKKFNIRYWKIVAIVSYSSNFTHMLSPLMGHLFASAKLEFPVCSYSFLSETFADTFKYPIYFYQCLGIHFQMLYNLNIDTYFLGLMIFVIAQLDILEEKLTNSATYSSRKGRSSSNDISDEKECISQLHNAIIHYDDVNRFCVLIHDVFSVTLFVQFAMASCIICVCLFRFTMPAPFEYFVFLASYMFVMIIQIMVPCWFGTCIMDKSCLLSKAVYNSDWTGKNRRFKSSMRLFVERANRPFCIIGWKMFPLALTTFTSIMNSAYSFFTLLRNVQAQ